MPPKLVASDLDGTLLTSEGTFDERTKRAIATVEAAGATVVFCTARPPRWMRPLAEAAGHRGVAICATGVGKASALARLCQARGIDRTDVIAFGDMPNDLPMLAWAGHSVAVANAHPEVIAAADELTASNDESGVALVLERLFS